MFYSLLQRCIALAPKHGFSFKNKLITLDATIIELCLSLFPWAKFRARKGALKLHCALEHSGNIPVFMAITDGKCHEITAAKERFPIVSDSIYCFDKGYTDFDWFRYINNAGAFFVTRAKDNLDFAIVGQHEPKDVIADVEIEKNGFKMRLINYFDAETGNCLRFLTNNFAFSAKTIAEIYKSRWQIEAFFKWIKQNLRIKSFLGTTENAVMAQIWVAMCYYLLLAYIKFQTKYKWSVYYLHGIVKEALMEKLMLIDLGNLNRERLERFRREEGEGEGQLSFQF